MKALIIKTGLTETFDHLASKPGHTENSSVISLGDVARSTTLLHTLQSEYEIHWFTSTEALPLLRNLPNVKVESDTLDNILEQKFDLIVNLERDIKTLKIVSQFTSLVRIIGYFLDEAENILVNTLKNEPVEINQWLASDKVKKLNWSQKLFLLAEKKLEK